MSIPKDPFMLLSWANTKLRDEYSSLEELCSAEDCSADYLKNTLADAGFEYLPEQNQFR